MRELRPYQEMAISLVRDCFAAGNKRVVMVLPTGGGKSLIFAGIINLLLARKKTALFLVHRRNLVNQFVDTLNEQGIDGIGIIMAGHKAATHEPVQVGTIQTYSRRLKLDKLGSNRFFIDADLVLVDEAHLSVGKRYQEVLGLYHDKLIAGCTATPVRGDGRGLGEVFEAIVDVADVKELTDGEFLCPVRYFTLPTPDLSGVKIKKGDYDETELNKRCNTTKLVGDIVENWLRIAPGEQTIIFCVSVKHSIAVCDAFKEKGIRAYHLDAKSPDEEREYAFKEMENGNVQVLCNVALYQEGMDCPNISCVVMARPTKSLGLYRQCGGRGLRPAPGKRCLKLIDHGGCYEEHGPLDMELEWSLDGKEKAWKEVKKKEPKESKTVKCTVCHAVFEGVNRCPDCGSPVQSFGKKIEVVAGDLEEVGGKKQMDAVERRRFLGMLLFFQRNKGYKQGWVSWKYKERTGKFPKSLDMVSAIPPDGPFLRWIQHMNIKAAKSSGRSATPYLDQLREEALR